MSILFKKNYPITDVPSLTSQRENIQTFKSLTEERDSGTSFFNSRFLVKQKRNEADPICSQKERLETTRNKQIGGRRQR